MPADYVDSLPISAKRNDDILPRIIADAVLLRENGHSKSMAVVKSAFDALRGRPVLVTEALARGLNRSADVVPQIRRGCAQ